MNKAPHENPSFEEVADKLSKPLERYLKRFVGDPDITEDLLQETLMRISKALPGFEGRSSIKNWAFTVATNTVIDHVRKTKSSSNIVEINDSVIPPDDHDTLGERLIIDEMNSCVRQEIDSLPEDYRAALILHDLEGLTGYR
jgi:RNA polymerase sigma-70 factor (ECF subfamily)